MNEPQIEISLEAVIVAVTENAPRLLTVAGPDGGYALPSGLLEPHDRTLELGVRRWVAEQTGLDLQYLEQLYTFGDRHRGEVEQKSGPGPRRLSIVYLALVQEEEPSAGASWHDFYDFLPWEDHRLGRPALVDEDIGGALDHFVATDSTLADERAERIKIVFGAPGTDAQFDGIRALERYELLHEAGLVSESDASLSSRQSHSPRSHSPSPVVSKSSAMYLDHRRMVATALGRLRGKLTYRPVVFELLPDRFTLLRLQQVVEALAGFPLHKQNFRRLVEGAGLVEGTGEQMSTGGRPAELFQFRREVLGERPRPGVGTRWVSPS